jgi:hypothetical protein
MNATEIRDEILSWMNHVPPLNGCAIPSAGERGTIIGLMNSALKLNGNMGLANDRRRAVLAWIFRDILNKPMASGISAKELSDEMWWALSKWASVTKDQDTGKWVGKLGFEDDMITCLNAIESWQRDMDKQLGFDML